MLETELMRVTFDAMDGAKISSLSSKQTGMEYFYQDPRSDFGTGQAYGNHSISGFDECFPTVWACPYQDGAHRGQVIRDHGYLWGRPWEYHFTNKQQLVMTCCIPELDCQFQRTCQLESASSLRFDYQITNRSSEPLKYLYSAHPLLATYSDTRLVLPAEIQDVFVFFVANHPGLANSSWVKWPIDGANDLVPPYIGKRQTCLKVYTRQLAQGRAEIQHENLGEGLRFEFDCQQLPHLGILIQQGYDENPQGEFIGETFLALEPTTGIGDDLLTCKSTDTLAELSPTNPKQFSLSMSLVTC